MLFYELNEHGEMLVGIGGREETFGGEKMSKMNGNAIIDVNERTQPCIIFSTSM